MFQSHTYIPEDGEIRFEQSGDASLDGNLRIGRRNIIMLHELSPSEIRAIARHLQRYADDKEQAEVKEEWKWTGNKESD